MDAAKSSAPARPTLDPATRLPDHEVIRLDAAAHPERTHSEYVEAAREIAGRTYVEDLRRISPAAQPTLPCDSPWRGPLLTLMQERGFSEVG